MTTTEKKRRGELWAYKLNDEQYHRFVIRLGGRVFLFMDGDSMSWDDACESGNFIKLLGFVHLDAQFNSGKYLVIGK